MDEIAQALATMFAASLERLFKRLLPKPFPRSAFEEKSGDQSDHNRDDSEIVETDVEP
jgi:hypothetical protein